MTPRPRRGATDRPGGVLRPAARRGGRLLVLAAGALAPFAVGAAALSAAGAPAAGARPRPPVVHEVFSPTLPCDHRTTVGELGCEEHALLAADARIDREVAVIFPLLHDDAARRRLVRAEVAWLAFRVADCASQSDIYEGGSQAAVAAAACAVYDDGARSADLRRFYDGLVQGRSTSATFP